jgi:hypothetical protein
MLPSETGYAVKRAPLIAGIAVVLVIAVLAMPVKVRCGAPGYSCATALDAQGNVHYYYEVEPLGVYLLEIITGSNIRFFYKSGDELVKVRSWSAGEETCPTASAGMPASPPQQDWS